MRENQTRYCNTTYEGTTCYLRQHIGKGTPMMGSKQRHFAPLIQVSLEELIPQDHFYRHLERTLDLSCVREFVAKTYAGSGRPSIDPVVFFKLQLVMFFEAIRSERQLIRHAADRLSVRWFLGVRHVTQGSIPSETERTRRRFFGSRAYLAPKGNGDNSMLLTQEGGQSVVATGLARPARYGESWIA
jgi:transposase